MKKICKILIYRIGNLGDTVCAIPAMVAVRQRFPDAKVVLLTNKETTGNPDTEEILQGNDFVDEIITYDPTRLKNICYLKEFIKKIRLLQIDLLVYLSLSESTHMRLIRDWVLFSLLGCKKRVGFKLPKPIDTRRVKGIKIPIFLQEVDRLMSLLIPLGVDTSKIDFRLPIKDDDKRNVDILWNEYNLKDKNPIIVICPGAKFPAKRWDIKNFVNLILILQKLFRATIILIGGPSDKADGETIIKKVGSSTVNFIGRTTYMESAEIMLRCNLLISNDCGPVHLAAAVGTPVVGIYSSRSFPGLWHPWGKNHIVLRNDSVSCRFCFRTECKTKECINSIGVEQVIEACSKYLE